MSDRPAGDPVSGRRAGTPTARRQARAPISGRQAGMPAARRQARPPISGRPGWDAELAPTSQPADYVPGGRRSGFALPGRPAEIAPPGRPGQPGRPPAGPGQNRHRGRNVALAVIIVLVGIAGLAGIGYKLSHRPDGSVPPPTVTTTVQATVGDPARTVRDYFAAINHHRYLVAWRLSGEREKYSAFVAGFAGTAHVDHREPDGAPEREAVRGRADVAPTALPCRRTTSAWNIIGSGSFTSTCTMRRVSGPAAFFASTASLPMKPPGLSGRPRSRARPRAPSRCCRCRGRSRGSPSPSAGWRAP
jgi:hypothetical protein